MAPSFVMMKRQPVLFFFLVFLALTAGVAIGLRVLLQWPWIVNGLLGANLATFLLWTHDKMQSKRRGWRVPENALHLMAACGGSPAAFLAMKVLRHKTLKRRFALLYSIVLVLQLALAWRFSS